MDHKEYKLEFSNVEEIIDNIVRNPEEFDNYILVIGEQIEQLNTIIDLVLHDKLSNKVFKEKMVFRYIGNMKRISKFLKKENNHDSG